ncbi:MAG: serine/threonine-protein kinase [Planctomycetota bacterium]
MSSDVGEQAEESLGFQLDDLFQRIQHGDENLTSPESEANSMVGLLKDLWAAADTTPQFHQCDRLGKYRLKRTLGLGGQSTTLLARDSDLQRDVVLKIYHRGAANSTHSNVCEEGRKLVKIDSTHVVRCLSYENLSDGRDKTGDADDRAIPILVLEYVPGTSLDVYLQSQPSMECLRQLFTKLAAGLQAVHDVGLVHRDIKPSNIIVDNNDNPTLIDFGLAFDRTGDQHLPVAGTPMYMSPEQAACSRPIDARSDIFSLGVVMHQAFTGRPLFAANNREETLALIQRGDIPAPDSINTAVPRDLSDACMKCLASDPMQRYLTSAELMRALMNTPSRRIRIKAFAVAAVLALFAAVALAFFRGFFAPSKDVGPFGEGNTSGTGPKSAHVYRGTDEDEWLSSDFGNSSLHGLGGNDQLQASVGTGNYVDGGPGNDRLVIYHARQAECKLTRTTNGSIIITGPDVNAQQMEIEIQNIESIQFADRIIETSSFTEIQ